jgi:hypothetical protein
MSLPALLNGFCPFLTNGYLHLLKSNLQTRSRKESCAAGFFFAFYLVTIRNGNEWNRRNFRALDKFVRKYEKITE